MCTEQGGEVGQALASSLLDARDGIRCFAFLCTLVGLAVRWKQSSSLSSDSDGCWGVTQPSIARSVRGAEIGGSNPLDPTISLSYNLQLIGAPQLVLPVSDYLSTNRRGNSVCVEVGESRPLPQTIVDGLLAWLTSGLREDTPGVSLGILTAH